MSTVRNTKSETRHPIGLFCADLHLSDKPRIARAGEEDWFEKMRLVLDFISETGGHAGVPVFVAGDIFHKARVSPQLELLAMQWMKGWHVIPGQHDLPNHQIEQIGQSSLGVLGENTVEIYEPCIVRYFPPSMMKISVFPYGTELKSLSIEDVKERDPKIALIHHMVWDKKPPYPGASESGNVKNIVKQLEGFDVIVAGDNHQGFVTKVGKTVVINCGSVMRRTADQLLYRPHIYMLYNDLSVESIPVPIAEDVFSREHIEKEKERDARIDAFVDSLRDDMEVELSFERNLERYLDENDIGKSVRQILAEAME